jgi:plasmid stabilization system protein ParE
MGKIKWTDLAENDLLEIETYIAQDSFTYAFITSEKIINRTFILEKFPKSGRIVPEFENPNIRELIEGNYRIVYFLKGNKGITILRIHHASRLLK